MTTDENDPLLHYLLELVKELDSDNIPVVLGGGMSLYLHLNSRTKFSLFHRRTIT